MSKMQRNKFRRWTAGENEKLLVLYPDTSNVVLGKLFHRSPEKVTRRAIRLGVQKSREYIARQFNERVNRTKKRWGRNNPNYKRGWFKTGDGYIRTRRNGGEIRIHRLIMSKFLGRPLLPEEHIHHLDENKLNNDISNLVVVSNSEHRKKYHLKQSLENLSKTRTHRKQEV